MAVDEPRLAAVVAAADAGDGAADAVVVLDVVAVADGDDAVVVASAVVAAAGDAVVVVAAAVVDVAGFLGVVFLVRVPSRVVRLEVVLLSGWKEAFQQGWCGTCAMGSGFRPPLYAGYLHLA